MAKKKRKLLVSKNSPQLRPLADLIQKQRHKTLVLWAIDCSDRILDIFETYYPQDMRPRNAIEAARSWSKGDIKMPLAKKAAHAAHNAANDVVENSAACAAARATGHVVGTVHVATHAMGFVIYALTSLIYASDNQNDFDEVISTESEWLYKRLKYWEANIDNMNTTWADFLKRD